MRRFSTFLMSMLAVGFLPAMAVAQPSISSLTPAAIPPGKATEVTIHGAKLERPLQVWTSFPAEVELVAPANEEEAKKVDAVRCKITPAAGVAVGVAGIAVEISQPSRESTSLPSMTCQSSAIAVTTTQRKKPSLWSYRRE